MENISSLFWLWIAVLVFIGFRLRHAGWMEFPLLMAWIVLIGFLVFDVVKLIFGFR